MAKAMWIAAMIASLGVAGTALAQGPAPGRGPGRPGPGRLFDPKTVVTVSGEITAVRQVEGRRQAGVHLDLKTSEGVYDVHVGPAPFLDAKGLKLAQGDQLVVTGSKVELGGKPALIAQTVKKGEATVTLRDSNGVPAWSRRGSR